MSTLSNWMTQLFLFLILATLVDWMVPSSEIKKYVRLALAFVFMTVLLKPLVPIVNMMNQNPSSLEINSEPLKEKYDSKIELRKKEIEKMSRAYIEEEAETQLKTKVNSQLKKDWGMEILSINVRFDSRQAHSQEVKEVSVKMKSLSGKKIALTSKVQLAIQKLLADSWELEPEKLIIDQEVG
jgi:stage III sporulation protein AF